MGQAQHPDHAGLPALHRAGGARGLSFLQVILPVMLALSAGHMVALTLGTTQGFMPIFDLVSHRGPTLMNFASACVAHFLASGEMRPSSAESTRFFPCQPAHNPLSLAERW